ncbi:MAG: elongation factor G [Nitrospira sp.]|nr:elongation factor G [Nitrospira sp.]MCP9440983.1 elongation factor G [Nitrospira sp.]
MEDICAVPIRNVAIVSHAGAGKTSLSEALLFVGGAIPAIGSITEGTTVSDFEPEELHHHCSVSTSVLRFSWNQTHITLLDTPGALSLIGEPLAALRAVDAVIVVLDSQGAIRTELTRLWRRIEELALPSLVFVNGLDREGASIDRALEACRTQLHCQPIPMVVPVGLGPQLEGVIDLLSGSFVRSVSHTAKPQLLPIPPTLELAFKEKRRQLVEMVAESDETLLEAYLAQEDLPHDTLLTGLRSAVLTRRLIPLYAGSALQTVGIWTLLNAVVALLPSPSEQGTAHPLPGTHPNTGQPCTWRGTEQEPFSALVFKTLIDPFVGRLSYCRVFSGAVQADSTVWNASRQSREKLGHFYTLLGKRHTLVGSAKAGDIIAIGKLHDTHTGDTLCQERDPVRYPDLGLPRPVLSYAIEAKSKVEIEKVGLGLHKLIEEDPTLEFARNAETKEMVLSGLGQLHIDLALERLRRKFGTEVSLHAPKIPYRETVRTVSHAQGKYKKQTGGHGQYGDCWLEVAPLPRGKGFLFENRIVGGVIPRNFIPAIEKGVVEAMREGVLGGFPVVDVHVAVYDGSYHVVDSSELAFKIAGAMAFKKATETAHPVLLEPIMAVEIETPADAVGAVMGDLSGRRGRIQSVNADAQIERIHALVPLAELLTYTTTLNSLTGGRGTYVMEFSRYEDVPNELAARIVEQHKAERHAAAFP